MLGIFALTVQSVQGALMVMINHGISTGALFLLIGMIYERRHTRLIEDYGGIAQVVPMFATLLTLVALSSIGCRARTDSSASSSCCSASFKTHPVLDGDRGDRRDLRRGVPAVGDPAHPLQSARQAGERARAGPQLARARAACCRSSPAIIWLGVYPAPVLAPHGSRRPTQFVRTVESSARSRRRAAGGGR